MDWLPARLRGTVLRATALLDRDGAAVAIVLALLLLAFSPWWAAGRVFAPLDILSEFYEPWAGGDREVRAHNHFTSDAVTQYLVYRRFAERSYAEDGSVGWSELTDGGRPEYANTMALYDDWAMQLHRFLDFWTAWHLGLLGHFAVAALGMLVFLRSQGIPPLLGAAGAIAYAANSQHILWIYHRWQLGAFAWVPWLAWAAYRYGAGRRWAWPLVPIFLALALLGGNLQTNAFVVLVVAALWLGQVLGGREGGPAAGSTADFAAWTALGLGLASFALVPNALAFLETAAQGIGRGGIGYAHGPLQPVLSLLFVPAQAFPSLLGSPRSIDLSKVLKLDLTYIAYFGFLPAVIALRAALLPRAPRGARWLIALGLLLPLTPLVGPLYHRVQLLYIFGGVWAFAWYWQHAERGRADPAIRAAGYACFALLGLWLVASLASVLLEAGLVGAVERHVASRIARGRAGTFGVYEEWMLERARRLVPEMRLWHPRQAVAAATALLGFAALRLRARRGVGAATPVLLVALVVELGVFAAGWVSVVDPRRYPPYPVTRDIAEVKARVGGGRVYVAADPQRPTILLPPNTLAMYGIASIQAYESISPPGMWQAQGSPADPPALGQLGVTHAIARSGRALPEGWSLEYDGDRLALWRNEHAVPRYLALRPAAAALLERPGPAPGWLAAARLDAPVSVVAATQNRRLLEAPAGAGGVRLAENWSEGWRYRVEGGPWRRAEMAADRSMVVPLDAPAAPVRIELRYRPGRRRAGLWVSLAALLATAGGAWLAIRRPLPSLAAPPAAARPGAIAVAGQG